MTVTTIDDFECAGDFAEADPKAFTLYLENVVHGYILPLPMEAAQAASACSAMEPNRRIAEILLCFIQDYPDDRVKEGAILGLCAHRSIHDVPQVVGTLALSDDILGRVAKDVLATWALDDKHQL